MSNGIRFTDEFKQDAVAQVVERGYTVSEVAERLVISTKSLYTWKLQFAKSPRVRSDDLPPEAPSFITRVCGSLVISSAMPEPFSRLRYAVVLRCSLYAKSLTFRPYLQVP